jgi:glycosyltransferase involved in cell wall biosynthesis
MKLLLVAGAFPPEPLAEANHAFQLAEALAAAGHEVDVLTRRGAVAGGSGFRVHALMPGWRWRDAPRMMRMIRDCRPDAVLMIYISFCFDDHPMATFAPTLSKRSAPGVPFVTQFENSLGVKAESCRLPTRMARRLVKSWAGATGVDYEYGTLLRDSDRVIVLSRRIEDRLAAHDPGVRTKSAFVPPAPLLRMQPDPDGAIRQHGRDRLGIRADEVALVYFGFIYLSKGLETLLPAFREVRASIPEARLVIAGGLASHLHDERVPYLEGLRALATRLGIQDAVTWTGRLDWDTNDASECLRAADLCVLPFDDGISMNNSTYAAAAAHGLPVVSTRGRVLEPEFRDGENVLLCPPQDPDALARTLVRAIRDPALRSRLREGASRMAEEWFSWHGSMQRTVDALQ